MVRLENWRVYDDPFKFPVRFTGIRLQGNVFGDARFEDNTSIVTNFITGRSGDKVVTKSGTVYALGVVNPPYGNTYPNAFERLMLSLPEVKTPRSKK